jgi:flagellar hook assembly protein FlgD
MKKTLLSLFVFFLQMFGVQPIWGQTTVAVEWTDAVGVSVSGNTITKTAATDVWDSGAASTQSFSGNGAVIFQANETSKRRMCGLSPTNAGPDQASIAYGLYLTHTGIIQVYENGVLKLSNGGTYQVGDLFSVKRTGTTITYLKNGTTFYTSTVASSGFLLVDASIRTSGGTIANAQFSEVADEPAALLSPNSNAILTASPMTFSWSKGWGVSEYRLEVGTSAGGNDLHNQNYGTALSSTPVTIPLSGGPIYVRLSSLLGASWQFRDYVFGATTPVDVVWTNLVGVSVSGNTITKTTGGSAWNSGAASTVSFSGDGGVIFQANETNTHRICGLSSWDPNADYTSIAYGLYPTNTGTVLVYENGTYRGNFGSYVVGDQFRVYRKGVKVYYQKNNTIFYTSTVTSTSSLLVDSSIYSVGGTIAQGRIFSVTNTPAAISSPVPSSIIALPSATFQWTTGSGASEYRLAIGTSVGAGDIYDQNQGTNTTATVSGIPLTGQILYVRLYSNLSGTWQYNDYSYPTKAEIPLEFGASVTQSTLTANNVDRYRFTANSGDQLIIPYTKVSGDYYYSPNVELFDSSNNLIAAASGSPFTRTLTVSGTYYLHVTDQGQNSTGSYSLTLQRKNNPGNVTSVSYGNAVTASTTNVTEIDVYSFSGAAGESLVIPYSKAVGSVYGYVPVLELYNSAGTKLATSTIAPFTYNLSSAGTYYLWVADDNYKETGSCSLTLQRRINPGSPIPLAFGATFDPAGTGVGEVDIYEIPAEAGDNIVIEFTNTTGWGPVPVLELYNSSGTLVHQATVFPLTTSLPTTGTYYLWVYDSEYNHPMTYRLTLVDNLLTNVSVDRTFLNRSLLETSTIGFTLERSSDVVIGLYRVTLTDSGVYQETFVENVHTGVRPKGPNTFAWNGNDSSGTPMTPGVYAYTIQANAGLRQGEHDPEYAFGTVGVTNRVIESPVFDPYQGESAILKYDLLTPAWVTLKIGVNQESTPRKTMMINQPLEALGNSHQWDGRDDSGNILPAGDYIGVAWTNLLPDNAIVVKPSTMAVTTVTANPYAFFPVYHESTEVSYGVSEDAVVSVSIMDPSGTNVVRDLITNEATSSGTHVISWDGRDNSGRVVDSAGHHVIRVTATDLSGATTVIRKGNSTVFR